MQCFEVSGLTQSMCSRHLISTMQLLRRHFDPERMSFSKSRCALRSPRPITSSRLHAIAVLKIGVNHNFLYSAAYERLRKIIHSGAIGPLDHVTFNYFYELPQITLRAL